MSYINKDGVSVIFPVFNTEQYVKESLNSILNQKEALLEVLCIDDCGNDQSSNIIREIAMVDNRVKIIQNKQRMGVSYCLNIALPLCKYSLVAYVDSDDLVISDSFFKDAINKFSQDSNAELLIARPYIWHNEKLLPFKTFKDNPTKLKVKTLAHEEWSRNKYDDVKIFLLQASIHRQLWAKIYKKSFLERINIHFLEQSEWPYPGADDIWFHYMIIKAKSIILFEQFVYLYNFHGDSFSYDKRHHLIASIRDQKVDEIAKKFFLPKLDSLQADGLLSKYGALFLKDISKYFWFTDFGDPKFINYIMKKYNLVNQ